MREDLLVRAQAHRMSSPIHRQRPSSVNYFNPSIILLHTTGVTLRFPVASWSNNDVESCWADRCVHEKVQWEAKKGHCRQILWPLIVLIGFTWPDF